MKLRATLAMAALAAGAVALSGPAQAGGGHMECHMDGNDQRVCTLVGSDSGGSGGSGGSSKPSKPSGGGGGGGATTCRAADGTFGAITSQKLDPQPPPPVWATGPGTWYHVYCGTPPHYRDDEWIQDGGAAAGAVPTNFSDLVQKQLQLQPPTIHMNPDPTKDQIVRVPTWLWVNDNDIGVHSDSVHAGPTPGGVTVSGTIRADTVTFDMGDGTPPVVCKGAAATTDPRPSGPSNCSHTYATSSATQPDHAFTVTATVTWSGDYTATDDTGATTTGTVDPFTLTSQATVRVAEAQSINNG